MPRPFDPEVVVRVNGEGQVTIPEEVRDALGIRPRSEVDFVEEAIGRWYLVKRRAGDATSRFRRAHEVARPRMSSEELLALTRSDS